MTSLRIGKDCLDAKKWPRRAWLAALWVVCLIPSVCAFLANPETFWQTCSVGCAQILTGAIALAVTGIVIMET
jgi:hypothetical protein